MNAFYKNLARILFFGIGISTAPNSFSQGATAGIFNIPGLKHGVSSYIMNNEEFYARERTGTSQAQNPTPPPANDDCSSVAPVTLATDIPVIFSGTTLGATSVNDGGFSSLPTVWHAFTLTSCADVTIDFCGTSPVFGNGWRYLATSCPATTTREADIYNQNCNGGDLNWKYKYSNLPAGSYWIPVMGEYPGYNTPGPYVVTVTATNCLPPPANDICSAVIPVTLAHNIPSVFTGTTVGATAGNDGPYISYPAVWHAFTLAECASVTIDFCATSPAQRYELWYLFRSCPISTSFVSANSLSQSCPTGGLNWKFVYNNLSPGTYWMPVIGNVQNYNSPGPYTVSVKAIFCIPPPPPVPVNDDCSSVVPLTLNNGLPHTFTGTTLGATSANDGGFSSKPTVWHAFTITSCATVTLDYCATTPALKNRWTVLATSCPAFSIAETGSVSLNCTGGGFNRKLIFNNLPAGTYWIPVMGYDPGNNIAGPYSLTVTAEFCPVPSNDDCSAVIPVLLELDVPRVFSGTTFGATASTDAAFNAVPTVWHAFTISTCADVTIDYCTTNPAYRSSWKYLATSCPAVTFTSIANSSSQSCVGGGLNWRLVFNSLPAGTYWIPVMGGDYSSFNTPGPYSLSVTASACPPPPLNDLCTTAIPIICGSTVNATTLGGNPDITDCRSFSSAGIWYSFTQDTNAEITISLCASSFDTYLSVYTGNCGNLSCVIQDDDYCGTGRGSQVVFNANALTTYYILVNGWSVSAGAFILSVTCSCIAPVLNCPENITVSNDEGQCGANVSFTATANGTSPVISFSQNPDTFFPIGTTAITAYAVNSCGTSSGTFTVTVNDTEKPVLLPALPPALTVSCNAVPVPPVLEVTDNCPGVSAVSFKSVRSNGTCTDNYTLLNTWSATDANNNTANLTQIITVIDDTKPVFTRPPDITIPFSPGCGYNVSVSVTGDVTNESDNCSSGLQASFVDVSEWCGNTLVITRTWQLVDNCGNAAPDQVQTITVSDNSSSYIIYAAKEAKFGEDNFINGDVGVMDINGKAEFKKGDVLDPYVVRARNIIVQQPSSVSNRIFGPATGGPNPPFLTYIANPLTGNHSQSVNGVVPYGNFRNLTIKKGVIARVDGSHYGKVSIEEGADVTFTSSDINMEELIVGKGKRGVTVTTLSFTTCAAVKIKDKVTIEEDVHVNVNGPKVTLYIRERPSGEECFMIKGDNTRVTLNIFMPTGKLKVIGGTENCIMNGWFIVERLESIGSNIFWSKYDCAALISQKKRIKSSDSVTDNPVMKDVSFRVYATPNPTMKDFFIRVFSRSDKPVSVRIFELSGKLLEAKSAYSKDYTISIGENLKAGIYFAEVTQGGYRKMVKLIKMN